MSRRNRDKRCRNISAHRQKKSTICLCCIVKDDSEAHLFERMLASFMPYMHGLAVAITGVSGKVDQLCQLVDTYAGTYIVTSPDTHPHIYHQDETGNWFFAHFAEARNLSFQLADELGTFDWLAWADSDDVLVAGHELQVRADEALARGRSSTLFPNWYRIHRHADGTFSHADVEQETMVERLLRPGRFIWKFRVNEDTVPLEPFEGGREANWLYCDYNPQEGRNAVWSHLPDSGHFELSLRRNILILEMQRQEEIHEGQPNPHTAFQLGRLYASVGHYQQAGQLLREYLLSRGEPKPGDRDSYGPWEALRMIGHVAALRGDALEAIDSYREAARWIPTAPITLLWIASQYAHIGLLDSAREFLAKAKGLLDGGGDLPLVVVGPHYQSALLAEVETLLACNTNELQSWSAMSHPCKGYSSHAALQAVSHTPLRETYY